MNVIVHSVGAVGCAIVRWPLEIPQDEAIERFVPQGETAIIADDSALPSESMSAWKIVDNTIVVDSGAMKPELLAYAASKRFDVETGGISVDGLQIRTDRESQATINGAFSATLIDQNFTTDWKGADGTWQTIDAAAIHIIASTVKDHVKACFAAEKLVDAGIEAGTITTREQIDAAAWPANG